MKVRVGAIQFKHSKKFKENLAKVEKHLKSMATKKTNFVLASGEFSLKEPIDEIPGKSSRPLQELAQRFNVNLVAPLRERRGAERVPHGYSVTVVIDKKGEIAGIQEKQHFYPRERPWFRPGKEVKLFELEGVRIGLVRGLDVLYPEYTRKLIEAEVLFFPTMAPDNLMLDFAKVRAIENQCYVVMSSYIGKMVGIDFKENAAIMGPQGILERIENEGTIEAELDTVFIRRMRKKRSVWNL